MAEVLITLAIIGVVAAMTIPTLTQNYKKKVVETRLARFYSTMNQAMQLSSIDNGPINTWTYFTGGDVYDENGVVVGTTSNGTLAWFNKYMAPYMKTLKVEENDNGAIVVYFLDGSAFRFHAYASAFYPFASDYTRNIGEAGTGTKRFLFMIDNMPTSSAFKYHHGKGLEPYMVSWNGTRDDLLNNTAYGCRESVSVERAYCTKLIQLNNWKIPDDYPLKF